MKHLLLAVSLLVLVGLVGISIDKYETRPQPKPGETVQQAVAAEATAKQTLKEHDAVAQAASTSAQATIAALTGQKATLCLQLHNARLSQPLCN